MALMAYIINTLKERSSLDEALADPKWRMAMEAEYESFDVTETFAPTARMETIRVVFHTTAHKSWVLIQMDAKSAFLNGHPKEGVYVMQPPRFELPNSDNKIESVGVLKSLIINPWVLVTDFSYGEREFANRGSSSGRDEQNLDKWLVSPQAKLHRSHSRVSKKKLHLDQRITRIEEYLAKSSRGGDPMDISSAPRSEDDSSDEETEDKEEGFEEEGEQEREEGTEDEGDQEEEEEEERQEEGFEEEGQEEEEENH
ncbi:uncharacterized protein LOC131160882 [Malania oleifera]|uniref:uncharacterized protein LOC131160882 n=1 Tax=Malania oleifera TaxID=397392 RepID=UPI0025ADAA71|nr:uncharacterized protein LOC131160882 [Malania oleifera]